MSCFKDGIYYALISDVTGKNKILTSFEKNFRLEDILYKAADYKIVGEYIFSSEDNAIITDSCTLQHVLKKNGTLIISSDWLPLTLDSS